MPIDVCTSHLAILDLDPCLVSWKNDGPMYLNKASLVAMDGEWSGIATALIYCADQDSFNDGFCIDYEITS